MNEPNPPPTPYNPYLAPQQQYGQPYGYAQPPPPNYGLERLALNGWVKWVYLFLTFAAFAGGPFIGFIAGALGAFTPQITALVSAAVQVLSWAKIGAALLWIYLVWEALPAELRSDVSPGGAVGRLFIPVYNLVWIFQLQTILCDALDALFLRREQRADSPRALSVLAPVIHLVAQVATLIAVATKSPFTALAFPLVSGIVWTIYMFQIDRARTALASEGRLVRA